ncbi:VF530 family protein [Formosimonas limnophila]|nr:VF530 family protein [Formosimonas limnophila]
MTISNPQRNNPLHGLTLEFILTKLVAYYGWAGLFERIPLKCFDHEPSIKSSLKLLRKTPWAREKVEGLYGFMLREVRRGRGAVVSDEVDDADDGVDNPWLRKSE